jgi:hypothetical protein
MGAGAAMSLWQQLGGFVDTAENLSDDTLARFAAVGGAWIVPILYGDTSAAPYNLTYIESIKQQAARHGVKVGCWANGWAGDPQADATNIAAIATGHSLDPIILDCEAAYQKNPDVLPHLLKNVRVALPKANLCVSTNSLNDSLIWNGRGLTPQESARRLGYRVAPQWYSSPNYTGCWTDPVCNMEWLAGPGGSTDNLRDITYANKRAVPLSYVHPTLETTGLEQADLAFSLRQLALAKQHGFTQGLSLYLLENAPDTDFTLVGSYRGKLYL